MNPFFVILIAMLACVRESTAQSADAKALARAEFDSRVSSSLRVRGGGFAHVDVWAEIDGGLAGWFIFDSGASSSHLTKSAAKRLGLKLEFLGSTAGVGKSVRAFSAQASSLQVGPLILKAPRFVIAEVDPQQSSDLLGTLGGDIFAASVVIYDHMRPSVEIHDPKIYANPPVEWEKCILLDGKPFSKMLVESQDVLLEIDTGGGQGVLLCTPAARRLGLTEGRPSREALIYGPYGSAAVREVTLASFQVGAHRFDGLTGTLGVEDKLWLGSTEHDGLIGAPVLGQLVVIFDYGRSRISFTDRRVLGLLAKGELDRAAVQYAASQATGPPDAIDRGTYGNAWFPGDDLGQHWLELSYDPPVNPERIELWGTNDQPGLSMIRATAADGSQITIDWSGKVERVLADGLSLTASSVQVNQALALLRLEIDCAKITGTNVIDAVGLVDSAGVTHWAHRAKGDSSLMAMRTPLENPLGILHAHLQRLQDRGQEQDAERVRVLLENLPGKAGDESKRRSK